MLLALLGTGGGLEAERAVLAVLEARGVDESVLLPRLRVCATGGKCVRELVLEDFLRREPCGRGEGPVVGAGAGMLYPRSSRSSLEALESYELGRESGLAI